MNTSDASILCHYTLASNTSEVVYHNSLNKAGPWATFFF